jgi:hypothetical protein
LAVLARLATFYNRRDFAGLLRVLADELDRGSSDENSACECTPGGSSKSGSIRAERRREAHRQLLG